MSGDPGSQDYLLGNFLVNLGAGARDPASHRNKRVAISPGTGASTGTAGAARPGFVGEGEDCCPGAVLQAKFGEDAAAVGLDGLLADRQVPADLPVAVTAGD